MSRRLLNLAAPFAILSAACSTSKAPVTASSGDQTAYAVRYSDELATTTKAATETQARAKTLSAGLSAYVDQLKKPDWQRVELVIDDSDEAGKSTDFADGEAEAAAVRAFWDSEKNDLNARVVGGTNAKLKEAGCTAEVGGSIAWALNEGVNKELQKRLRSRNEAFVVIERYKTALGPQNTAALEKLADDVSEASYDVHVLLTSQRNRLKQLAADKSDVKKTLDRFIQEESDFQAEAGRTDAEKKASIDRVNVATKNKADLDNVASQAEAAAKDMDKSIDGALEEYDKALKNLKAKVAEKKKAEPPREPSKASTARARRASSF